MLRTAAIVLTLACAVGCRAPKPSFNVFAPYGSSRVPPPPTGSMGNPDAYYQPPSNSPARQAPTQPSDSSRPNLGAPVESGPIPTPMGATNPTRDDSSSRPVALATYESADGSAEDSDPSPAADHGQKLQPLPTDTKTTDTKTRPPASTLKLRGMRVNDATRAEEPESESQADEPAGQVSQDSRRTPSLLRIVNQRTIESGTVASTGEDVASNTNWQSR